MRRALHGNVLSPFVLLLLVTLAALACGNQALADTPLPQPAETIRPLDAVDSASIALTAADEPACETASADVSACRACDEPWVVSREPLLSTSYLDLFTRLGHSFDGDRRLRIPISGGAWHWFHQSLIGRPGGYGIPGLRNTYFWYLYFDPEYTTRGGQTLGGHVELRLRETDTFRTFIDDKVWTWEAYAYWKDEQLGTLKAGQLYNRFGLFWDGVFFGNAPYFDGLKLDADYGLSWEKTTRVHDRLSLDSYVQYFFHEDQSNGSFAGADPESIAGYTEKNTGVIRLVPTWTRCDGSQVAIGFSAMVGEIDSRIALPDETLWAYGFDITYTKGPWKLFAEASQTFGVRNPVNYVSGGPSDQLTNILAGIHYTRGAVTYRVSYSNSIYEDPDAVQNMVVAGITATVSKHMDLYIEYVNERVNDADLPGRNGFFFNGIEWVINWHF